MPQELAPSTLHMADFDQAVQPDAVEIPSLYRDFAQTEVTVFGMTGTIEQLGDLCPVPPEQRSNEAMEKFTAKILQQAGVEIPDKYGAIISDQAEKPQQTQAKQPTEQEKPGAAPKPAVASEHIQEKPVENKATIPTVESTPVVETVTPLATVPELEQREAFIPAVTTSTLENTIQTQVAASIEASVPVTAIPSDAEVIERQQINQMIVQAAETITPSAEQHDTVVDRPPAPNLELSSEQPTQVTSIDTLDMLYASQIAESSDDEEVSESIATLAVDEQLDAVAVEAVPESYASIEASDIQAITVSEELSENIEADPATTYQAFVEALAQMQDIETNDKLAASPSAQIETTEAAITDSPSSESLQPAQPSLRSEIVAHLREADEVVQAEVTPLVVELTAALQAVSALQAERVEDTADAELSTQELELKENITQLCIKICERLDIPVDKTAIAELLARMTQPDFTASLDVTGANLIDEGTHERKTDAQLAFASNDSGLTPTPHLHSILGTLTLAMLRRPREELSQAA